MEREIIFEKQSISGFQFFEMYGMYAKSIIPAPFALTVGENYIVAWDDDEYPVTAVDISALFPGGIAVGNGSGFGLPGNNEPFIVAVFETDITLFVLDPTDTRDTHSFGAYKEIEEETPVNIILRNPMGEEEEYPMRPMIEVDTTDGNTALYSKGEVLDSITIEPDFSAGDMTVSAPDGYLVKSAVIAKPPNLVPENIPVGINIAGVDGAREEAGGGSEEACVFLYTHAQSKLWAKSSSALTLSHTVSFPKAFEVVNARVLCNDSATTYISAPNAITLASPVRIVPTVTNDSSTNTQTVSYSYSTTPGSSVYYNIFAFLIVVLKITGFVVKEQNGVSILCALENADISALHGKFQPATSVQMVDFSAIQGTVDIPSQMLYGYTDITKVVFPPNIGTVNDSIFAHCPNINTVVFSGNVKKLSGSVFSTSARTPSISSVVFMGDVTTITNYVFAQSSFVDGYVLDMSRCTKVPTLANSAFSYSPGTANNNPQIRVPAALYDEWIAAENWTEYASYIVPV